jgi:hypothetical protein
MDEEGYITVHSPRLARGIYTIRTGSSDAEDSGPMDSARQPEHSAEQHDSPVTPTEARELVAIFGDPHLFRALLEYLEQALAEDLPPGPIIWMLKWWGVARGVYPADRMPPAPVEELKALLSRLS